jgi:hypothetical protein
MAIKKGMIGDSGYTNILLEEGEYEVKVEKASSNGEWLYTKTRTVFLGANSSVKLNFRLDSIATEKRKARLEKDFKRQLALDKESGTVVIGDLMWKRCSEGQTWTGSTCRGSADKYEWQEALNYAKDVSYAGYSDWRVPTIKEINTLVYCSNGSIQYKLDGYNSLPCTRDGNYQRPTINQTLFPNTPEATFWSSSPYLDYSDSAWRLYFDSGSDGGGTYQGYSYRVRLVRNK